MNTLSYVLSAFIVCFTTLTACTPPGSNLVKLAMPGQYRVNLRAKTYQIWFARSWKSRSVSSTDSQINIQILDGSSKPVEQVKAPANFGKQYASTSHNVEMYSTCKIPVSDNYTIQSGQSIVVIIVPTDAVKVGLDSQFSIPGIDSEDGSVK